MRDKIFKILAKVHTNHPWRMASIVFVLTVLFGLLATQLKQTMRWSDLLPEGDRRTVQFNKIIEEFVSATSIVVVVQGEEERIKQFADELAPRLLTTTDVSKNALIRRVDYKTEMDFLRNHGLMLVKEKDLENTKDIFKDPNLTGLLFNINNGMEKEYVGQEESISTREKEDQAVVFLDGIQSLILLMQRVAQGEEIHETEVRSAVDKLLLGESYFLSYDKKTLILNAIPNFTVMDTELLVEGTEIIQSILDDLSEDFPDVQAGLTGMIPIGHDEMVYSQKSLGYTSVIAVIAIFILLVVSFRMWVAPVFAMMNLLVGILWAMGTVTVILGQLNIMTQMMSVILLGLGIDFSIHIISGFTEWRAAGDSIADAMEKTFLRSGKGILTGGLTTACAFLTMVISRSRGMKEMGLVTGAGLLAILGATFLFLPLLLVFRERFIDRRREWSQKGGPVVRRDISFRFLGGAAEWLSRRFVFTILASAVITLLLVWSGLNITFDQNYMNIEPEGLTSIALQDTVLDKFDLSMDYALILTDNVDQSREMAKKYREMGSVALTEDISLYLPSVEQQERRIPHITEVREAIGSAAIRPSLLPSELAAIKKEVERLQMNMMEIQDMAFLGGQDKVDTKCKQIVGDPESPESKNAIQELQKILEDTPFLAVEGLSKFQHDFAPYFKNSVITMCSTEMIRLDGLPVSILDRYSNKDHTQFLVTVFPAGNIWQSAEFLDRFTDDLDRVSDRATGMPPVFRALIDVIGSDGRNAVVLTLVIVFVLLWLDFRHPRTALIAMIPLCTGVLWMVGLMYLTGMQFTVMNVMGLPMIVGIGIDDGVHVVHRWMIEGKGKVRTVFSSTGKAILLTSLTTMLAFGSLVFSIWRGFGQLGGALFLGVATCFLTTVLIISGIMGLVERKR